jgi:hypothetical protein
VPAQRPLGERVPAARLDELQRKACAAAETAAGAIAAEAGTADTAAAPATASATIAVGMSRLLKALVPPRFG